MKHGNGKQVWFNGSFYQGLWDRNQPRGFGRFCYANGDIYEGYFYEGVFFGTGTYYFKDGRV